MSLKFKSIKFSTKNKFEVIDITDKIEDFVQESNVKDGILYVHAPHATTAIIQNENESGLRKDYKEIIDKLFSGNWEHDKIDNNAIAHIASAIIGNTKILLIKDGKLVRGTWENIMILELDGPRPSRKVVISLLEN